jgi:nitrite reductase/ring-hydroxylating ferredoxin subunit
MDPNGSAKSLVNLRDGEISREIFVNADLYEQEKARIFARAWLYIGHESQIKKPGDFFVSRMGEESVILTRDRDAKIHVFLNTCRHRGMRVCRYDEGHANALYCPYHGWSYGLDGKLMVVQQFEETYSPPFNKEEWGLVEVAQIANVQGTRRRHPSPTIWVTRSRGSKTRSAPGTAAIMASSCSARRRNGSCRRTGNSSPRISPATCSIPSATAPSRWSESDPARQVSAAIRRAKRC